MIYHICLSNVSLRLVFVHVYLVRPYIIIPRSSMLTDIAMSLCACQVNMNKKKEKKPLVVVRVNPTSNNSEKIEIVYLTSSDRLSIDVSYTAKMRDKSHVP
jgi:hypothetical protein